MLTQLRAQPLRLLLALGLLAEGLSLQRFVLRVSRASNSHLARETLQLRLNGLGVLLSLFPRALRLLLLLAGADLQLEELRLLALQLRLQLHQ